MSKPRPHPTKKKAMHHPRPRVTKGSGSCYFVQPGKRGSVIVLRKPCGNRATAKVCGVMPSRTHAKALVEQLERAESAVNDLFYEATDDGIEALEAVLAACREAVLAKLPVTTARNELLREVEFQTGAVHAAAPEEPTAQ